MGGGKMINMKDLIKQQTNMIRKETGMNIKEIAVVTKPKVGDYLRDGNTLFAKIIEIRKDEVITNNMSGKWSKNVTKIAFKLKKLKDSGKRNVGRPIWVPK